MTKTVVIMAAGRGSRMKHLTQDRPKHLIPVLGRPFIEHLFDRLRTAGFEELLIVTGHENHAFSVYREVADIRLIEQRQFHHRYGTAAAIETVKSVIGSRSFAVVAGDNLYSANDLRKMTTDASVTWVGGYRTAAWQGMGVLQLRPDGSLDRIVEKPSTFVGDLINSSLYHFTPAVFEQIERLKPSPRGEYEITDALNAIALTDGVSVFELEDRWLDLTAPSDVEKIERALRSEP